MGLGEGGLGLEGREEGEENGEGIPALLSLLLRLSRKIGP